MTPQEKKYLKWGIGALAVGTVIYLALKNNDNGGGDNDPTGNNGSPGSTLPSFNAGNVAENLYEAMRYTGTDEDAVIDVLRYVSASQFDKVFTAFGKRQYNSTLGNQVNPTSWFDELPFVDLKGWLKSELSDSEYKNLQRKYPSKL